MDKKNMKVAVYFRTATTPIEQKSGSTPVPNIQSKQSLEI